jgi:ABC-type lipoprotein export system ATPase subunit
MCYSGLYRGGVTAQRAGGQGQTSRDIAGEPVMNETNFIIEAKEIHKTYRMGLAEVRVLKGADIAVKKGEFVAITGASGSGKSTLLHILGALDSPDKGIIHFEGQSLSGMSGSELNRYRNKSIGFVFQFYHLLDELNILENAILPAMVPAGIISWLSKRGTVKQQGKELLETVGLAERTNHKPYQLSGGERQRAAIARALINEPKLLLADEPTGNLDSATGNGILELLERLNRAGQTIIMVTHDERISRRAGRTITLADGKIK